MPLARTRKDPSSSQAGPYANKRKPQVSPSDSATPGASKIKAALRQTRRLLAKDKLAADVRVETERRLKALEADLQAAEAANKERTVAERYHKHRFFEKQKLTRKITRTKKQLADEGLSSKDRRKLEKEILALRVDVNYVLHWPKTERYISLFPPDIRQNASGEAPMPVHLKKGEEPTSETDKKREDMRTWVRERMESGELSAEPELDQNVHSMKASGNSRVSFSTVRRASANIRALAHSGETEDDAPGLVERSAQLVKKRPGSIHPSISEESSKGLKRSKAHTKSSPAKGQSQQPTNAGVGLEGDDFFGED